MVLFNVGVNPSALSSRNSDARIPEQRGNNKSSLLFLGTSGPEQLPTKETASRPTRVSGNVLVKVLSGVTRISMIAGTVVAAGIRGVVMHQEFENNKSEPLQHADYAGPSVGATEGCWREDQSISTRQKSIPAIRRMRALPSKTWRNSAVSGTHSSSPRRKSDPPMRCNILPSSISWPFNT